MLCLRRKANITPTCGRSVPLLPVNSFHRCQMPSPTHGPSSAQRALEACMTCSPMYTFLKPWKKPSTATSSRCRLCSPYRCACAPVSTTCSRPNTRAARSPSIVSCDRGSDGRQRSHPSSSTSAFPQTTSIHRTCDRAPAVSERAVEREYHVSMATNVHLYTSETA